MSRAFKRSDGLIVFADYDPTNPRERKSLVIDTTGREIVISIPREATWTPEKVREVAETMVLDDAFQIDNLFRLEEVIK